MIRPRRIRDVDAVRGALAAHAVWLLPALTLVALWPLLWSDGHHLGDHFTFWYAGRLLAEGRSPYDPAAWADALAYGPEPGGVAVNAVARQAELGVPVWLYPPWAGYAFVPFGLLPVDVGTAALHAAFLLLVVGGVLMLAALAPVAPLDRGFVVAALLASYPAVIAIRGGNPAGALVVGLALVAIGLRSRRAWALAAGLLLLSLKPHVVALVALASLAALVARGDRRTIAALGAMLALVVGAGLARHPESIGALAAGSGDAFRALEDYASTWSFAAAVADDAGPLLAAAALAMLAGASALAVRRAATARRFWLGGAAVAAVGVAIPPYLGAYDHLVALVPAALVAALSWDDPRSRGLPALAIALVAVAVPWLLFALSRGAGHWLLGVVPALCAGAVIASAARSRAATTRA